MSRVVGGFIVGWVLLLIALKLFEPLDDTDNGRFERSGMILYVDARTGCHYLSKPFSVLVPRMGADGKQVCEAKR